MSPVLEIEDRARIAEILGGDPIDHLEALDESILGVDGLVTVLSTEEPRPANYCAIRWGQKSLGLGSVATLTATRLLGLAELLAIFPAEKGLFELSFPFWASGAIDGAFKAAPSGAEARYRVTKPELVASPAVRQCVRLDDHDIVKPMFPKLADDTPVHVLSLNGELVSVAVVTHLHRELARVTAYTVEALRGRGFGRAVLTALSEELLALGITPTASVDLADEPSVRMLEGAGFSMTHARLKAKITGRRLGEPGPGLVGLGRS